MPVTNPAQQSTQSLKAVQNKTAAYTVVAGDLNAIINCTANTFTVSLDAAATLGSGFGTTIINSGTGVITIDTNGTETVDGFDPVLKLKLSQGSGVTLECNGVGWITKSTRTSGSATAGILATQIGRNSNGDHAVATQSGSISLAGSYSSGLDSFAAIITNNTSSYGATADNTIAMARLAKASGIGAIAIGGQSSEVSLAAGTVSMALAPGAYAEQVGSTAIGYCARAYEKYKYSFGGQKFSNSTLAESQSGFIHLLKATTDATPSDLTSDKAVVSAINQVILRNNSLYAFHGYVMARQKASEGTAAAVFKVEGAIRREGTAATTVLITSSVTAITNIPGWEVALSADTVNGGLKVTVTGAAATNLRFTSKIETLELNAYA